MLLPLINASTMDLILFSSFDFLEVIFYNYVVVLIVLFAAFEKVGGVTHKKHQKRKCGVS